MQTEGAISLNRTILLLHFGRGDSCTQNRTHLYSRVTWTHTQVQFPSYRTPSSSHTPLQTLLSVFFPPECRGQVSHTDPFHLLYRRKINLPHLLLKSLWFQMCQGGDLFSSCRNISDIVWPKHELVAKRTLSQSLACFSFFFFFCFEKSLSAPKNTWQRRHSQPTAAQLGMLDTFCYGFDP